MTGQRAGHLIGIFSALSILFVTTSIASSQTLDNYNTYLPFISRQNDQPLAACLPAGAPTQNVPVTYVVDGDTIHVLLNGANYSLRYIGIDTPESTNVIEYYGPEAAARNKALVNGKIVTIVKDVSETDRYGRLLRYVFVGTTFVNYQLVRKGFATAVSYPPDTSCYRYFKEAEEQARAEKRGIWAVSPTETPETEPCNCTGPDLDCADFPTYIAAQACFDHCWQMGYGDIFRLDGDADGLACESLP